MEVPGSVIKALYVLPIYMCITNKLTPVSGVGGRFAMIYFSLLGSLGG